MADQGSIHPYKAKFWKAYLGEAYTLWEHVRLNSSGPAGWSALQTYQIDELAAGLQTTPEAITGEAADGTHRPWLDENLRRFREDGLN